jgi:pilus assembly protein FimV
MIITCKECNSSFNVDDGLIKETGSKVRCSKCETIFLAYPNAPEDDLFLDSDEQLPDTDGSSELDDLESSLDGLLNEDDPLETAASQKDADDELGLGLGLDPQFGENEDSSASAFGTEEPELALSDFEDKLDMKPGPTTEDMPEENVGELDLDLDLDDSAGPLAAEASMIGDELPDLEELSALDDQPVSADDADALLEDLDLDLEAEENQEVTDSEFGADDELDQADIDLEKEENTELEVPSTEDAEDLNLDLLLDQDAEDQEDSEISEAGLALEETDELDLSELGLESDDPPVAETDSGEDSEDLDLDLLLDQDAEDQEDTEISEAGLALEETDELDLSELGLESDDPPVAETDSGEDSEDLDLDLLLDQDAEDQEDTEISEAGLALEETDELDLSDLNLESDDSPVAETASGEDLEDLDFDLDLESETIAGDEKNMADELDLSDLEEIIDSESDEPTGNLPDALEQAADTNATAEEDDELDFSDLEKMLESDEAPEPSAKDGNADELDLQFDIDEPAAGIVDTPVSGDAGHGDQVDELLDIDKMLEENEDTVDEDLESPLEMDAAFDDASKEEGEFELDFDLESELQEKEDLFDGSATADEQLESNLLTSDETGASDQAGMEELEFDEEELQGAVTTDEFATDELLETSDAYDSTDVPRTIDGPPSAPAAMMPKSRSKKPVLVALLLLFLAGGILIVPNMLGIKIPYISDINIPYLSDLDMKIPYLSEKLNPKEKDMAGNLKIIPMGGTITARFVNDSQGNPRFVIHGKIKNDYDHPRSFIKVTGKIYQKGGKLAKTETVFCGNLLSDSELTGMEIAAINKRLHNRFGDKKSNLKVKTGKSIPFMIVFDELPQNLDEYTIEVDGSSI